MNNKPTMDNLDDEFETSWNTQQPDIKDDTTPIIDSEIDINTNIKEDMISIIDINEIKIVDNPTENKKMTALEALVNNRTPTVHLDNIIDEDTISKQKECRKMMLEEYKERGILVNNIDESMIIEGWVDCYHLGANPNIQYLKLLVKSVIDHGFESPRPIQCITAGRIAKKGDLIVQAKAGNGKTAAFVFGSAIGINPTQFKTQVLILSPTQLLTDQTTEVAKNLTSQTGLTIHCHRGGLPLVRDNKIPHIIVGCPGRIIDLIKRKKINLNFLKTVILDEGDELLKQGFREQVKNIIETLDDTVQICLFSATLPKGILELCTKFMRDPAYVILPENQVITELVTQWYVKCNTIYEKDGCLVDLIKANPSDTIIVFFNSCSRLEKVSQILCSLDYPISHLCIHGKMDSIDKTNSITNFISGKYKILLASDIAARGLDIQNITLVINYDIPASNDTYAHRIARSGRGAFFGNSVTFVMTEEDKQKITFIVQVHGIPIKALKTVNMELKTK